MTESRTLTDTKCGTGFTCTCDVTPPEFCPQHMDIPQQRADTTFQKYVVGFYFDPSGEKVVLVRKNRPAWQAGKLNGVGGHIEEGEMPIDAMVREFFEETEVQTMHRDWRQFATVGGSGFLVFFFVTHNAFPVYRTVTDEDIGLYSVDELLRGTYPMIPNLRWLIPLALDKDKVFAEVLDPNSQE